MHSLKLNSDKCTRRKLQTVSVKGTVQFQETVLHLCWLTTVLENRAHSSCSLPQTNLGWSNSKLSQARREKLVYCVYLYTTSQLIRQTSVGHQDRLGIWGGKVEIESSAKTNEPLCWGRLWGRVIMGRFWCHWGSWSWKDKSQHWGDELLWWQGVCKIFLCSLLSFAVSLKLLF